MREKTRVTISIQAKLCKLDDQTNEHEQILIIDQK